MCLIDDASEPFGFYREAWHKARKEHRCNECRRTILQGEIYLVAVGGSRDGVWRFKTCAHCRIAQQWLVCECSGFLHGMVEEDLLEHLRERPLAGALSLAKLVVGARRKWKRFYCEGLMPIPAL